MKKFLLTLFLSLTVYGQTIKDISNIVGIRENQLIGYGLVVGTSGQDGDAISEQTLQNLLRNANIKLDEDSPQGNVGAVVVTATLPAFARQGDKIQVDVSSLDGANLDGSRLLVTQLKGVDGQVYALAQGTVMGITPSADRKRSRQDESKTGFIYDGAIVENEIPYDLNAETSITLSLIKQNARIAAMVETRINEKFGNKIATAYDTRTIKVMKPNNMSTVLFIAEVEDIKIDILMKKKVIIDPVKEIVIAGADITISPVTISRETFTIRIKKSDLSDKAWNDDAVNTGKNLGDEVRLDQLPSDEINRPIVNPIDMDNALINSKGQPTVSDLMRAMKMMNVSITERIETIQMLDSLGAINADVEIVR